MKKLLLKSSKKSLALILSVLLVLTSWVWIAPTKAEAYTEISSILTAEQLSAFKTFIGVASTDTHVVNTTYGTFKDDGTQDTGKTYHKNVFLSGEAKKQVGISSYTLSDNAIQTANIYYPDTVLIYDGTTTPQFGLTLVFDSHNGCKLFHWGTSISGTNLSFVNSNWYGGVDGTTNGSFMSVMASSNKQCGKTSSSADVDTGSYYAPSKDGWASVSNVVKYTGNLGSDRNSATYYTTIPVEFKSHFSQDENSGCNATGYKGDKKDVPLGKASSSIAVINIIPWKTALEHAANQYKLILTNGEQNYTPDSVTAFKKYAKALFDAHPSKLVTGVGNVSEFSKNKTAVNDYYNNGQLVEARFKVTYKNGSTTVKEYTDLKYNSDVPVYSETNFTKAPDATYHYEFNGWNPTPGGKVTSDITYDAVFKPIEHTIATKKENNKDATCAVAGSYTLVTYCSVCDHEIKRENKTQAPTGAHVYTKKIISDTYKKADATCEKYATYYYACEVCNAKAPVATFEYAEGGYAAHKIEKVNGEPAMCNSTGIKEHYKCTECGKLYSDAEGKNEITENDTIAPMLPHTEKVIPAVAPSCYDYGYTEGKECTVCGMLTVEPQTIDMLPHEDKNHDHICDNGCGDEISEHVDNNYDHKCDNGCAEEDFGAHEDTDFDHICDYGCSESIGVHEDKDKDHICDYGCDAEIGVCQDANKDHLCDYGCGAEYGDHEDTDLDHDCDYGCDETIGKHEDTDFDHECDYGCSERIGNCEDNDKDHDCDYGCDNYFGEHIDADLDHNCDYGCTVKIGEHADAEDDKDHKCDYCGEDNMNPHINSEVVIENDVKATCETNGSYDEVIYCTVCDAEISRKTVVVDALTHGWTVEYNWSADGKACTATRVCANDESHNQIAEATINSEIIRDPACGVRGITKYTATFAAGWAVPQVVELDDIDPKCPDTDKNHYCDNNEGNKDHYVGVHEDKNKDHVCDYGCKESIGAHEDKDKDHKCDWGCGGDFGLDQCKDDNKDHKCDYGCSKKYGDHADSDTDNDHKCDYCGEDNMNPHVEGAEHEEERVEPTCSKKGSYKLVVRCTVCNVVLRSETKSIDTIPHTWKAEIEYSFNEKTEEFTATRTCSVCGATESASKKAEVTVTVQVTCNNPGEKVYTVKNIVDWAPDAQTKVVAVPQLQHEDADKDHYCDNGCGNVTGTCEDLNFDHYCDYGRNCKLTVYPAHEDKDNDHKCDYGCRTKDFAAHEWKAHSEIDTIKTPATCVSPAIYNSHCEYCGKIVEGATHTYGEVDTENGHRFDGKAVAVEGDKHAVKCTNEGCNEIKSVDCSYQTTKMVAATCKAAGYKVEKCPICKASKRTVLEIDPANHAGGTTVKNAFAATCNTDGYTGDVYCLGCDVKLEDGKAITANPNIHAHENMKDYEKVDSTCSAEGHEAYRYCDKCKTYAVEKVTIAKKAHEYEEYNSNGDGTHTATCGKCGETEKVACSGGKANCVDKKVCEFCNTAYGEVDLNNHKTRVTVPKKAATCQVEGNNPYIKCEACNTALEEITKIEKKAHSYGSWKKVAGENKHEKLCVTCDAEIGTVASIKEDCSGGYAYCNKLAVCNVCKSEYGSFDPAHHRSTVTTLVGVKAATCTVEGYTGDAYYICCYDANKSAEENASAFATKGTATAIVDHDYSVQVENESVAANCQEKGKNVYKCATCSETKTTEIRDNGVTIATKDGKTINVPADSVILSVGYKPAPVAEKSKHVHVIGDAFKVGSLRTVIWQAWDVAMKI